MKEKLIDAGVKNLREFGYQHCTKDNICTDMVYRRFFMSMLKDQGPQPKVVQDAIDELIAVCSSNPCHHAEPRFGGDSVDGAVGHS